MYGWSINSLCMEWNENTMSIYIYIFYIQYFGIEALCTPPEPFMYSYVIENMFEDAVCTLCTQPHMRRDNIDRTFSLEDVDDDDRTTTITTTASASVCQFVWKFYLYHIIVSRISIGLMQTIAVYPCAIFFHSKMLSAFWIFNNTKFRWPNIHELCGLCGIGTSRKLHILPLI